jgi:S-DNA-T family DNA segregation ATPase FtsK/SpoIIIE
VNVGNAENFGFDSCLALPGNLQRAVTDYAKREDQLVRDLRNRRSVVTRRNQEAAASLEGQHAANVAGTDAYVVAEKERLTTRYQARTARVQNYYLSTLRNLPARAQEAKATWLNALQLRKSQAEQTLEREQAAADATYADFKSESDASRKAILHLERRARGAFGGYWTFRRMLRRGPASPLTGTPGEAFEEIQRQLQSGETQLAAFRRFSLPRVFSIAQLPILFVIAVLAVAGIGWHAGFAPATLELAGGIAAALFVGAWVLQFVGFQQSKPAAVALSSTVVAARSLGEAVAATEPQQAAERDQSRRRSQEEQDARLQEIESEWSRSTEIPQEFEKKIRAKIQSRVPNLFEKIERVTNRRLHELDTNHVAWQGQLAAQIEPARQQLAEAQAAETASLDADDKARWDELESGWQREILPLVQALEAANTEANALFPPWDHFQPESWAPTITFPTAVKFGQLDLNLTRPPSQLPRDPRMQLPNATGISAPLALSLPSRGSVLLTTSGTGRTDALGALNNIILRLLATTPPGKLSFTIIDPVGLGQSFAGLMHLSDYEESLINRRIWTQRDQIEERLAELGEHIEKVIQMYLRNEYATISEYNEKAGSVAEKYHFLVVADFPANFSEIAAKRLQSIATSGPRCGVFTLVHWDDRQPMADGFQIDVLRKSSLCLRQKGPEWLLDQTKLDYKLDLTLDAPPPPDLAVTMAHKIGKSSIDSNRVQVPFSQIAPPPEEMWKGETTNELRVALGRTGATKFQYLAMGKGTRQHGLIAGKTGSGKSTLLHVIIMNLALNCSPEQVEFYLIDFKKGVEFKCYATQNLPHARVVAIESDREFALSVLQRLDDELRRRGDIFRKLGVQDVAGYKRSGAVEPMPRSLMIIDEFQEFFVDDDTIAQTASLLLDRIVRQGRAFGIHVILGSQTLGGAYSLARATLGQMTIRIALQCNEADAYLIMDESNSAPRLLSRPGEGIYNDAAGAMEGNSPFQVVWLPDDERDLWLQKVTDLAAQRPGAPYPHPLVFEGNTPADVRENPLLKNALETVPAGLPTVARAWLGAPNSIKGPTELPFQRQSGSHALIVGQRDEASMVMLGLSILALAAQYPKGGVQFVLLHNAAQGSAEAAFVDILAAALPNELTVVQGDASTAITNLGAELQARSSSEKHPQEMPAIFLCIHGLQKFKKLRQEDDFSFSMSSSESTANPGAEFSKLITDGSSYGIHVLAAIDTLNSINHFMNRKVLSEFAMRILFQMSANDSSSLIDSPKASGLGLHRALYYNEHDGYLETFRPYSMPDLEWLRTAAHLAART